MWLKNLTRFNTNLYRLRPERYKRRDDLHVFIKECLTYFEVTQTTSVIRDMTVIALFDKDLREEYDTVNKKIKGFEKRFKIHLKN